MTTGNCCQAMSQKSRTQIISYKTGGHEETIFPAHQRHETCGIQSQAGITIPFPQQEI